MPLSAADPDALVGYGSRTLAVDHELSRWSRRLGAAADQLLDDPARREDLGALAAELAALVRREAATGRWVAAVGDAFRRADAAGGALATPVLVADAYATLARDGGDVEVAAAAVAGLVAADARPAVLAGAAEALGPASLTALAEARPELVGPTDGLPVEVRYRANRLLVARALASERDPARRGALERLLRADPTTGRPRQLLLVDPTGDGRVVEVVGDLDRAGSVAVVVPGVDTDLASFDRRLARPAGALRSQAEETAADGVAVVAWLGYDPPDALAGDPLGAASVLGRGRARAGGAALGDLLAGVPERPGRRVTLVGHSYGSTTVAAALLAGARPDDVVVLGSPGVLVDRAADFDRPATAFWVLAAPHDPVARLARLGWFGGDPSAPGSGFRPLATGVSGHSRYLEVGSTSQANVAAVVAGTATVPARAGG